MSSRQAVQARPRSTVEILDDAWRIYFANSSFLLALTAFFYLPAATSLLLLLADPELSAKPWLPPLTAFLLPLTGLSAGACQEAFHSWAEDYPVSFWECMSASCRRGVYHIASQAIALVGPLALLVSLTTPRWAGGTRTFMGFMFVVLSVLIALFGFTRQPSFAAGKPRFWRAVHYSTQATGQNLGRALLFLILRGLLLVFAVLNLHLFARFALWVAEDLAGLEVAYIGVLCSLGNSAYLLALTLLAWCLLVPFHEAVGYLFFVDVRSRSEGLDLWQRIEIGFAPVKSKDNDVPQKTAKASAIGTALITLLTLASSASGQEPLATIRASRVELVSIKAEIKLADPFPGGLKWRPRLESIASRLDRTSPTPDAYRWFRQSLKDFPSLKKNDALARLDDLDKQLELLEESLSRQRHESSKGHTSDEIRSLIPPDSRQKKVKSTTPIEEKKKIEDDRLDQPPEDLRRGNFAPVGPGVVGPTGLGGAANALLVMLVGLGAAAVIAAVAYLVYTLWRDRIKEKPKAQGAVVQRSEELDDPTLRDPAQLWRQADEEARSGNYLAAVRTLYIAVLAVLHRGGLIKYQRTRTNGEYADQLRRRPPLHQPFVRLTSVFELKWFGQRTCESNDYRDCRELAEQLRVNTTSAQ